MDLAALSPSPAALLGSSALAADESLQGIAQRFEDYELDAPARGILDAKVAGAIEEFHPDLMRFRDAVNVLADETEHDAVAVLQPFFKSVLPWKRVRRTRNDLSPLWSDGYRFIIRELFLSAAAILSCKGATRTLAALLEQDFGSDERREDFVAFDSYVRSLDEFRDRRLRLEQYSVSAVMMRRRALPEKCSFMHMADCDALLCLRSILSPDGFFRRWYPRTLLALDPTAIDALPLVRAVRGEESFRPLRELLGFEHRKDLIDAFEDACARWPYDSWVLAGRPLELRALYGMPGR